MPLTFTNRADGQRFYAAHLNEVADAVEVISQQVYNVKESTFGAKGDGVTDDTAAIQAAIDAATANGGGRITGNEGTYRLTAKTTAGGISWHLSVIGDNIEFDFPPGAVFKSTETDGTRILFVTGAGKPAGAASWASNEYDDATLYTMTAASRGARTVTLATAADAGNVAAGDYIFIRTGQTITGSARGQPDSELNKVVSADAGTGIITLAWPLHKAYAQEYYTTGKTGITTATANQNIAITSSSAANPTVVTTTSAHGLATNDRVNISGHTGSTPDINGTHTVTVTGSTTFTIPVNVTVGGTGGGLAVLAPFGVHKVTDRTIRNFRCTGLEFSSTSEGHLIQLMQVDEARIENCLGTHAGAGFAGKDFHDAIIRGNTLRKTGSAANAYGIAPSTGCTDGVIEDNVLSAEAANAYLHIHEGVAGYKVQRNTLSSPGATTNDTLIDVRARAYNIQIRDNSLSFPGTIFTAIFVDELCTGGGAIEGNDIVVPAGSAAIAVRAAGWRVGRNDVSDGVVQFAMAALAPSANGYGPFPVEVSSVWVADDNQNPTIFTLPAYAVINSINLDVTQAFNSDGTDTISVGADADNVKFGTATDVSTVGLKTVAAGTGLGRYQSTSQVIEAYYVNGGTEPTTGKALVEVTWRRVPREVA